MPRFYLDEDIPLDLRDELRSAGHDAVHVRDLGTRGRPDSYHLTAAVEQDRIMVVYNRRHYVLLHDAWRRWSARWGVHDEHPGILGLPQMLPRELFLAIDVFLRSGLPVRNEFYSYEPATSWKREPFNP